ncbi:MAG: sigma-70 family RNA polymerase sigma factor [Dermatophilaceae bacterium]
MTESTTLVVVSPPTPLFDDEPEAVAPSELTAVERDAVRSLRYKKRRPSTSLEGLGADDDESDGEYDSFIAGDDENPHVFAERAELRRAIVTAMRDLPPDQRIAFVLSDVQGMSYEEVAEVTEANLGTVKSRLSRARARLREALLAQGELLPGQYRQNSIKA